MNEETSAGHVTEHKQGGLTQFPATAICGNDITSSCLYVSALAIIAAGRLAPVVLLIVAGVLYLFRPIYAEVVGALPLNGGAYNALLNTTSKFRASIAACLTILSYMATAVISANEAMHYAGIFEQGTPVIVATIGLLAIFAILTIIGITESSRVASAIFIVHLASLSVLLVVGVTYVAVKLGPETFLDNMSTPEPGGFRNAIFFGFAAALLGISGFESSANFVEEQAEGVFPKTLRNMWLAVGFFNPAMAVLALALVAISDVGAHKTGLLAHLGATSGGEWLRWVISIDAVLVLSGAVLTSFVGVNGLVRRMTLDRCLPQFLLKTNRRGTTHRIIIAFFLLAVSVLLVTEGRVEALAGVYTISFLSVMVLFCLGNILLKVKRSTLPRPSRAAWPTVFVAMLAVSAGLIGNTIQQPPEGQARNVVMFLEYFVPAILIVSIMLTRIAILKGSLFVVRAMIAAMLEPMHAVTQWIRKKIDEINAQQIVFFTRGDNISGLNNAMLYVRRNEHTNRLKVVTVVRDPADVPPRLKTDLEFLDEAYPEIDIEFVVLEGQFGPELIRELSQKWNIPANLMFIGSPRGHLMYGLAELGGVRLII